MYPYNDYTLVLAHHGVKGQKWYVRRYQNEDGTLTALGKQRLKKYKTGEAAKVHDYYDKRINKLETRQKEQGLSRSKQAKLDKLKKEVSVNLRALKKMNIEDMQKERITVGAAWIADTAILTASVANLFVGFSPASIFVLPNERNIKTNMRNAQLAKQEVKKSK